MPTRVRFACWRSIPTKRRVLAATSALLQAQGRKGDLVGRWGGEELVVALHCAASDGAMIAAERNPHRARRLDHHDGWP